MSSLRLPLLLLGGWLLMFWSAFAVSAAPAATSRYVAPTGADSGGCISIAAPCATIQYALDQAADGDVIVIAAGVYTENLQIAKSVTLHGADAATTVVDGSAQPRRVIAANFNPPLAITIRNLSIRNGKGGVIGSSGPLWVESSRIYHNDATGEFYDDGGGVYAFGPLTVHNTALYSNRGQYGGAIEARGLMTITASALYSNVAEYRGAIDYGVIGSGSHYIENSTISHNVANSGGAVGSTSPHNALLLRHVTIAANRTLSSPIAGIFSASTITVTLDHTIIANNVSDFAQPQQCALGVGTISLGNNIASDDTCNLTAAGDQPMTNPQLGSLQDNGGATWTHAIGTGSPALDAGNNSRCLATDQRGRVRPFDGDDNGVAVCDIGAYEFGAGDAPPPLQTDRYVAPSGNDANNDCANPAAPCTTIQHAIDQALTSGETVNIAAGTYLENLTIAKHIKLRGAGANDTIIDGSQGAKRVVEMPYLPAYTLDIEGLTLRNGKGGMVTGIGVTTLVDVEIYGSDATGEFYADGGGLYIFGPTTISNTAIYSNSGLHGGGVYARGDITITASAVYSNVAGESGGGIYIGVNTGESRATLHNATISGNRASSGAGIVAGATGTELTLRHVTVAYNQSATASNAPGGLVVALGVDARIANSIIALNTGGDQCNSGVNVTSLGGNLSGDNSCGLTNAADQLNADPLLNPLQDNGGSTWTHALAAGGPAVDAGVADHCLPADQRGLSRPQGAACDSGAYEADGSETPPAQRKLYLPAVLR